MSEKERLSRTLQRINTDDRKMDRNRTTQNPNRQCNNLQCTRSKYMVRNVYGRGAKVMAQRKYGVKGNAKYRWSYVITRRDENGKRCDVQKGGFKTKKEAKMAEAKKREELEYLKDNPIVIEDLVTVDSLYQQLIDKKRHEGKRESTIRTYDLTYNKWFKDTLGSRNIREVSKEELQRTIDEICPFLASVEKHIAILKNIYELAYFDGVVNRNLAKTITMKGDLLKEKVKVSDVFLEKEEIAPFFSNLSKFIGETKKFNSKREMLMYHLLLNTGLRSGEAIALRWSDIDFENKTINVTKAQQLEGKIYIEGKTKTKESVRMIPVVNEELYSMFKDWKKEQENLIELRGLEVPTNLTNLIFFDIGKMRRLKTSFYTETLNTFYRHYPSERKKVKSHGFRHTFTTLVRENEECAEKHASRYLGHTKNKTMTDRYTHNNNMKDLVIVAKIIDKKMKEIFENEAIT